MSVEDERDYAGANDPRSEDNFQRLMQMIAEGRLPTLDTQCDIVLAPGENCYGIIKGCWLAYFYAGLVGRAGRVLQGTEWVPVRPDALIKKHLGTLYVTSRRVCFVGPARTAELPLGKVIQCSVQDDAIHISSKGRLTNIHFILEPGPTVALTQALISKLASDAQRGRR